MCVLKQEDWHQWKCICMIFFLQIHLVQAFATTILITKDYTHVWSPALLYTLSATTAQALPEDKEEKLLEKHYSEIQWMYTNDCEENLSLSHYSCHTTSISRLHSACAVGCVYVPIMTPTMENRIYRGFFQMWIYWNSYKYLKMIFFFFFVFRCKQTTYSTLGFRSELVTVGAWLLHWGVRLGGPYVTVV